MFFKDVKWVENPPNIKEFSVKRIWKSIPNMKNAEEIIKYLPTYNSKTIPSKAYMLNVINVTILFLFLHTRLLIME